MKFKAGQKIIDLLRGKHRRKYTGYPYFKIYFFNYIVSYIPFYCIRLWYLKKVLGYTIADSAFIHLGCFILCQHLEIGEDTVIGPCVLMNGDIFIGKHCSVTHDVFLEGVTHDKNSPEFKGVSSPIIIEDYAWIGIRSVILPGVTIGRGAIVGANSTVTKTVSPLDIVAGSPAKTIGTRDIDACQYVHGYRPPWC